MKDPHEVAREMRAEGKSYAEIGRAVGRTSTTVKVWLDEKAAEAQRVRVAKSDEARRAPRQNLLPRA